MNFALRISWRYFLSKKKRNFINIISWLSILSTAFCTAALIIVLSVFNGFDVLLHALYASFDAELKIEAKKGKSFELTSSLISQVSAVPGVQVVTEVIEDYAYLRYRDADMVVVFKGVGNNFIEQHRLDEHIIEGELKLKQDGLNYAVIGRGIQHTLSIDITNEMYALQVFYVKSLIPSLFNTSKMYSKKNIKLGGVFSLEKSHDENYIFLPLTFAQELSGYGNRRTALEIKTDPTKITAIQKELKKIIGDQFYVLTQEEQQKDLFRLLKVEKLFTFFSLSLLILIGSINTFFSLMMLTLDKKKDLCVLAAMGCTKKTIRAIFLFEGAIISFMGAGAGLVLGGMLCWAQKTWGLVGLGIENAVVNSYPMEIVWSDFTAIGGIMVLVMLLVSFYPALLASRSYSTQHL